MRKEEVTDILKFLGRSKDLQRAERYGSSLAGMQNTVAEHSWRLGLMAYVIATECKLDIDMGHALSLALIHDLAEAKTGDIDAYTQIKEGKKLIEEKAREEATAMHEMTDDLSFGSRVFGLWQEYEDQKTMEAKFIKALDKIEGFLHIAEGEVEMYVPKEFHADYANQAVKAFDEATNHFPGLKELLDAIKENLRHQFDLAGVEWIDETA